MASMTMAPAMALALQANFGSVERWWQAFAAMAQTPAGSLGGVSLVFQPAEGTLANRFTQDLAPAEATGDVIVSFVPDDRFDHRRGEANAVANAPAATSESVAAFLDAIDWARAYERYQHVVHRASEPFGATAEQLRGARLVDVRRVGAFAESDSLIARAHWHDPAEVAAWAPELAADRVVVYCVYGHEVGRATALRLRAAGVDARFLRGGFDGWKAAGQPLQPKGEGT